MNCKKCCGNYYTFDIKFHNRFLCNSYSTVYDFACNDDSVVSPDDLEDMNGCSGYDFWVDYGFIEKNYKTICAIHNPLLIYSFRITIYESKKMRKKNSFQGCNKIYEKLFASKSNDSFYPYYPKLDGLPIYTYYKCLTEDIDTILKRIDDNQAISTKIIYNIILPFINQLLSLEILDNLEYERVVYYDTPYNFSYPKKFRFIYDSRDKNDFLNQLDNVINIIGNMLKTDDKIKDYIDNRIETILNDLKGI